MDPTYTQLNQISLARYGIDLNVPPEQQPQAPATDVNPAPENAPHVESNPPPRASQSELNRLMQTIARETYTEVTSADLTKSFKKLASSDRKALNTLATQAANALAAIKDLTVRDIVNTKDGSVEQLFKTAADLQFELASLLRETAEKPKYQTGKFDGYYQMLNDLSLTCDARASEILTLYMEVTTFAESQAIGKDSQLTAANAGDLLKGMAGSMHGNDKSIKFKEETDALESRLAQFAASSTVYPEDLNDLLRKTEDLSTKLKAGDVAETMDPEIHAQLTARLDALRADVTARTARALKASVAGLFNPVLALNDLGKEVEAYVAAHKKNLPALQGTLELMSYIRSEGVRNASSITNLYNQLTKFSDELSDDINKLYVLLKKDRPEIKLPLKRSRFFEELGIAREPLAKTMQIYREIQIRTAHGANDTSLLSGEDVVNAFRQDGKLSLLLETRIHGGADANINAQLCDANLVSSSKLGSGAANTVYKMTYKMDDGSTKDFVFKPDLGGRIGLDHLLIAQCSAYKNTQQTVKLNMATCNIAECLGLGRFVGKNYATVHNGQYGLLMEMAPGREAEKIAKNPTRDIREKFQDRAFVGKLAKELNDLRWLDIATGQGDRHHANYLVDLGAKGKAPKVTAIDNDLCMTPYLVGVGKFNVAHNETRFLYFKKQLKDACMKRNIYNDLVLDSNKFNALLKEIKDNHGVIDTKNACNEVLYALRMAFGFQSLTLPKQMSSSLNNKLVSLTDEQISTLANKLGSNVDDPNAVRAAVQRLKDLREIAQDYKQKGLVVEDDAWEKDPTVLDREREPGFQPTDCRTSVQVAAEFCTASMLRRDFKDLVNLKA